MPAAKDHKLLKGHWTKAQMEQKKAQKASVTPTVKLNPPKSIMSNISYYSIWKSIVKKFDGTELLNALDGDLLARYCVEKKSLLDLYKMRDEYKKLESWSIGTLLKIEARIEAKVRALNQMATSLYMNPRSRAGSIPNLPDKEPENDPNADMFD